MSHRTKLEEWNAAAEEAKDSKFDGKVSSKTVEKLLYKSNESPHPEIPFPIPLILISITLPSLNTTTVQAFTMQTKFAALLALAAAARAQQVCTSQAETHPSLTWQKCAAGGTCTNVAGSVVLDSNWRWAHTVEGSTNCYTGNTWNDTLCASGQGAACATKCCVDGADYPGTYGITASGNELNLKFVTTHAYGKNIGSRVYLMESESKYQAFTLLGDLTPMVLILMFED